MNQGHVRRRCPKPLAGKCESGRCGHAYEWRFSHDGRVFTGSEPTDRAARSAMTKAMAKAADGQLKTKREQRLEAAVETEAAAARAAAQQAADEARIRLGDYLDRWLDRRGDLKRATRQGYRVIIDRHVKARLGDVALVDLEKRHIRQLLEDLAEPDENGKVRTVATLSRVRSMLSGALEAAVDDELVPTNVAARVKIPERAAKGRGRLQHVFSPAQLEEFLRRADLTGETSRFGFSYGPILRFIAATGVRRGEAVGLLWDDLDLEAGVATIRHNLTLVGGEYALETTKTDEERRIPLLPEVVAMLRESLKARRIGPGPGYVFVRHDGTHLRPDGVTQVTEDITKAMGLPQLHLHSLRHSLGSAAIDAGVDVKVVADLLGHKSTSTTQQFYQRTSDDAARAGAEAIAAWRSSSKASGGAK